MKRSYPTLIRPLLFRMDPELMHHATVALGRWMGRPRLARHLLRRFFAMEDERLRTTVGGVNFPNPLGLAAGFDKNGQALHFLGALGFGHVEIGSVSAYPSSGNPRPRLFRLPQDQALLVHYGLPNEGAERVARRLRGEKFGMPLGINLVKTNDPQRPPTDEETVADYLRSVALLKDHGDYLCLNLSCPNTEHGRNYFDDPDKLDALLQQIRTWTPLPPVFLKVRPYADRGRLDEIVAVADPYDFLAGFAVNLPTGPPSGWNRPEEKGRPLPGAVSGKPIEGTINAAIAHLYQRLGRDSRYAIIGAGGVFTAREAYVKVKLGASLVQLLTGMIYQGPGVVRAILTGLIECLERDGFGKISEAVGKAW